MSKIFLSFLVFFALIPSNAVAQITPDSSLGAENSVVNSNGNRDTIQGGAVRNTNLFHSFQEFNVGVGREAYFANPNGINNIFSRVTGNNLSNIQGVLGVLGNANLYLINPNGILFGQNASLNVNGSFFATTADSVVFGNGIEFSATNPNQPPLLTIDIPIGLRFRDNPAPIINISVANDVGLQVKPEETLGLIGGNVVIGFPDPALDGKIIAPGSNIELGGLLATGTVTIGDDFKLSFPEAINKADVFLLNGAEVNVASDGGGAITINAKDITLIGGSQLVGGIAESLGNTNSQAGDITLNATGGIVLANESSVQNPVNRNATGNSGNINVNSNSLTLVSGSGFSTSTLGLGNGGDINVNVAEEVVLDGVTEDSITRFASVVSSGARGDAGEININAGSLTVSNGALINTRVSFAEDGNPGGIGNGGDINIDVKEAVTVAGFTQVNNDSEPIFSAVISRLGSGAEGSAGDINIRAGSLSLEDGGFLSGSTFGQGAAGDINVDVEEAVTINNTGGIFSAIGPDAIAPEGERSTVTIQAGSLSIADANSLINTSTLGIGNAGNVVIDVDGAIDIVGGEIRSFVNTEAEGNAGNINITARSLSLQDEGFLRSNTLGQGNAGNITIDVDENISLANGSFIGSAVLEDAVGQGGQINLIAKSLSLSGISFIATTTFSENEQSNGGNIEVNVAESLNLTGDSFLSSQTGGQGDAGNITINGEGATILIQGRENSDTGGISSSNNGMGNAGDISITAKSLSLEDYGFLNSNTSGNGNAGNITVFADETINFANNSRISTLVLEDAVGQGGQINLTAKSVSLSETSFISTSTLSDSEQSNGGNIEINVAESLNLTGGSFLNSATSGQGDAGNITINGEGATILIQGRSIENSNLVSSIENSSNAIGNAGDINITGRSLSLEDGGALSSNIFGQGLPGNITIDIEETVTLTNNGGISSFVDNDAILPEGENSTIQINTGSLSIAENSSISTFTFGNGNGGDVVIDVDEDFEVVGGFILSDLDRGAEGKAGDITITAGSLSLKDGAFFDSSTSAQGDSGIISITTDEAVTLSGAGTFILNTVEAGGVGNSQGISIEAESVSVTDGGEIQTLVRSASEDNPAGVGNAGNIDINTDDGVDLVGGSIRSSLGTEAEGSAGDITITARTLSLENSAVINSSTFGQGDSGIVSISTDETVTLSGAGTTIFNNVERGGVGNSQGISIEAKSLSITDGAQIQTLVRRASEANPAGVGNGGTIDINVRDGVNLSGIGVNSEGITVSSLISSALGTGAEGKAGDINITARSLFLENGARLSTTSGGQGDAGNINLDIQDTFNLSGFAFNSDETIIFSTSVRSALEAGAEGKAGDINLKAR